MQGALWATRLPGATFGCAYLPAARHCLAVCGDAGRVHLLDAGAAAGPGATRPLPWPEAAVLWLWNPEVDARAEACRGALAWPCRRERRSVSMRPAHCHHLLG